MKRIKNDSSNPIQRTTVKKTIATTHNSGETKLSSEKVSAKNFIIWGLVIFFITLISYSLAFKGEFTTWDDDEYVIKNPNLKNLESENIKNIFSEYYMGNYHPLAMLSLAIDYQIGGEDSKGNIRPFVFHFTSIFLHLLITLSVFWFVWLLFSNFKIAVISSLLFGVSTLHVESVAWVSERKDVLYALFFVLSLIFYLKYTEKKHIKFYLISIFLFILSLLSKGQAVSLSVTIIAIDILRKRNLLDLKVISEKIPYLLLALIFGIVAVNAQKAGNAIISSGEYGVIQRLAFASYAFVQYIIQLTFPVNLSAIYPYPDIINKIVPVHYYLFIIPAAAIGVLYLYSFLKYPKLSFLLAFFIINIILLLQFIPVGSALHADRYAYISSIGFYTIFAVGAIKLIEDKKVQANIVYSLAGIFALYQAYMTYERTKIWQNSEALWTDTCEKSPGAVVAWNNKGSILDKNAAAETEKGNHKKAVEIRKKAIEDFTKAISGKPDYVHAFYNRGSSKQEIAKVTGDKELMRSAINDFTSSVKFDPLFAEGYHNRGIGYDNLNILDSAVTDFNQAIELNPGEFNFYVNRGVALGKSGDFDASIKDFDFVILQDPKNASAYSNRGLAKSISGKHEDAIKDFDKAIQYKPNFTEALLNRAYAFQNSKNYNKAIEDLSNILKINPNDANAYFLRGQNSVYINNLNEACNDFQNALKLGDTRATEALQKYCSGNYKPDKSVKTDSGKTNPSSNNIKSEK